jgi:Xaa-Pro dipeptidase
MVHEGVRRSLEVNLAAYEAIRSGLRPGMTERDAYALVQSVVDDVCGAEPHEFIGDFVGGVRTGAIEGQPTDYVFKTGDLFILDLSVRRGETWSDTCRTFFFGEPTPRQREAYAAVLACQDEGTRHVRAGVVASSVRPPMAGVLELHGFGGRMPHHGGHLVGPEPYMKPAFENGCDELVKVGDVCTLEPGGYFEGEWGMRVENDYLVTEDGVENLFDYPREIEYFIIGGMS